MLLCKHVFEICLLLHTYIFPHFYWGLPWPPYLKLQPCARYVLSSSCSLLLSQGLTSWTTSVRSLSLLPSGNVWPVGKTRMRSEAGRRVGVLTHPTHSLQSSRARWIPQSEGFSIQSSISPYSGLLHPFDPSSPRVVTESYRILSFMIYLYPAHSFVNSPLGNTAQNIQSECSISSLPRSWVIQIAFPLNALPTSSLPYFSP